MISSGIGNGIPGGKYQDAIDIGIEFIFKVVLAD